LAGYKKPLGIRTPDKFARPPEDLISGKSSKRIRFPDLSDLIRCGVKRFAFGRVFVFRRQSVAMPLPLTLCQ